MKIGVNLTEEEARAFKAQKEQELGSGWCVDVYKWQGRWLARAYQGKRGPKPGTNGGVPVGFRRGCNAFAFAGKGSLRWGSQKR